MAVPYQVVYQYYSKNGKTLYEKVLKTESYSQAEKWARTYSKKYGEARLISGDFMRLTETFKNGEYYDDYTGF